jgi:hypothetical protein
MGLNGDFRHVMPQLAAVVGGGFVLRQAARGLIGLIPGLGIIPKVAVAFAGTYAAGEVIYNWCAYGERVTGQTLQDTYAAALERGKTFARALFQRDEKLEAVKTEPTEPIELPHPSSPPSPPSPPTSDST